MNDALKAQFKRKGMSDTDATKASVKEKGADGLVDMKRPKRSKSAMQTSPEPYSGDDYPYGLRIDFDDDMMTKLGMKMPEVGGKVKLVAEGTVERAELRDTGDGKKQSCCVQIKKMKVS